MAQPVRVAVMGMTGAGKSSLIKTIIPGADIAIGRNMNSQTIHPQSYQVTLNGTLYELIDTPGFGDTRRTDDEIFRCICQYLSNRYASGELFSGIIYLQSLAHTRIQGSMMAQIQAFKELCGTDFYSHLVIGTTFNETTTEAAAARSRREEQLFSSDGYFGDLIDFGAKRAKVTQDRNACINLIKTFTNYQPVPLQIQSELKASGGNANNTSAAAALSPEQTQRQREHEERVRREAEAAERKRFERERRAKKEQARKAEALAAVERQRQYEHEQRQREYAEQEQRRRKEEARRAYLREVEEEEAERQKAEAARARRLRAEEERKAALKRLLEESEREKREQEHRRRMEALKKEREAKERELKKISRSKEGFKYRHLSWYHSSTHCIGNLGKNCGVDFHNGMKCWKCEVVICFGCYEERKTSYHRDGCYFRDLYD